MHVHIQYYAITILLKLALSPGSLGTKLIAINNLIDITIKFTWASDKGPLLAYNRQINNSFPSEQ